MKIIDLEQTTPEWHEWRGKGIGSSDIATIMGANPYQTPYELWEVKCGLKSAFTGNKFTEHGKKNEEEARSWLHKNLGLDLKAYCIEHVSLPFFKASLDAYDQEKKILYEIKAPFSLEKIEKIKKEGKIPPYWKWQIQWEMYLSRAKHGYLAVWDFNSQECFCIPCEYDDKEEVAMVKAAGEFWEYVKRFTPPPLTARDYKEIEDVRLQALLEEYQWLSEEEKKVKAKKDELKNLILPFGEGKNFKAYGFTVSQCAPRSTYNYKQMEEDGIDIEKYKTLSNANSYRIMCPRKKDVEKN